MIMIHAVTMRVPRGCRPSKNTTPFIATPARSSMQINASTYASGLWILNLYVR